MVTSNEDTVARDLAWDLWSIAGIVKMVKDVLDHEDGSAEEKVETLRSDLENTLESNPDIFEPDCGDALLERYN